MIKYFDEFVNEQDTNNYTVSTEEIINTFSNKVTKGYKPLSTWFVELSEKFYEEEWKNNYDIESCKSLDEIEDIIDEYKEEWITYYEDMADKDDYNYKYYYQMVDFDGYNFHGLGNFGVFEKFLLYYFAIKFGFDF